MSRVKNKMTFLVICFTLVLLFVFIFQWPSYWAIPKDAKAKLALAELPRIPVHEGKSGSVSIQGHSVRDVQPLATSGNRIQDMCGQDRISQIEIKMAALAGASINIFGIVVDDLGAPLGEVEVTWSLGAVPSNQINCGLAKTNENGEFQISGVVAPTIHLTPRKAAYLAKSESIGTWFADVPCSKNSPLKLNMLKE